MEFAAAIFATTLSVKYAKNQIKKTYELSRRDFDCDKRILDIFSKQPSLMINNAALYMVKCSEIYQEHFNLNELISLLRNTPNLSHTQKLEVWSDLFNSGNHVIKLFIALRRMLFIISCFDLFIDNDRSTENSRMMQELEYYENFSPKYYYLNFILCSELT